MRCPYCSEENPAGAEKCGFCNSSLNASNPHQNTELDDMHGPVVEPDAVIAGRYRVIRELGRGGMGVVYLVEALALQNRLLALKLVHPFLAERPEAMARFEQEVNLCLDLSHPNIVRVHMLESWEDTRFFTMEHIEGKSLRQWLAARKAEGRPFTLAETAAVVGQLLEALSYAHQFTVHRDIKPENLMIVGDFPDVQVKVLDFGIARTMSISRLTQTAHAMGTAYYMAPEQMAGEPGIDHRADLYAVGMILYEMLTGRMAVGRFKLPGELGQKYSSVFDEIVEKALDPAAEERFESALKMLAALKHSHTAYQREERARKAAEARREQIGKPLAEGKKAFSEKRWEPAIEKFKAVLSAEAGHSDAAKGLKAAEEKLAEVARLEKYLRLSEEKGDAEAALKAIKALRPLVIDAAPLQSKQVEMERRLYEARTVTATAQRIAKLLSRCREAFEARQWKKAEGICALVLKVSPDNNDAQQLQQRAEVNAKKLDALSKRLETEAAVGNAQAAITVIDELMPLTSDDQALRKRREILADVVARESADREKPVPEQLAEAPSGVSAEVSAAVPVKKGSGRALVIIIGAALVAAAIGWVFSGQQKPSTAKSAVTSPVVERPVKEETPTRKIEPPPQTRPAQEPLTPVGTLCVDAHPASADVKIMNIKPSYYCGIELEAGSYLVRVSAAGYTTYEDWVTIGTGENKKPTITLEPVPLPPQTEPPKTSYEPKFVEPLIGATFEAIPAGSFTMGSPGSEPGRDDDEKQHRVTLSKGFYLQTTEVTQGQWKTVMGTNPSSFKNCGDDCPVEQVSWNDVQEFIQKLNQKTGRRYRLPTEAEWEYAARAGTTTPFSTGQCLSTDQANYDGNYPQAGCSKGQYRKTTVKAGSFSPNAWGLYDMHGNVWEWVQDWKGDYQAGPVTNPTGPASGAYRVLRGGSWSLYARRCRSADRSRYDPGYRSSRIGFRLAKDL